MTDGIKFKNIGAGVYVLTKTSKDGQKATITVNDFNKHQGLDNNDGVLISDPTSIFTAGEILNAFNTQKYEDTDKKQSKLPDVLASDNGKIAVGKSTKYNLGSFVTALNKMKPDAAVFASTEGAQATAEKPTAPAPAPAPAPESAPAPANIDYSAIQQFQYKWASALSSLIGGSYCGDGSALNLLMPSFLNAMITEGNGLFANMNLGANMDYSAMPDGAGFSGTSAWPAIPAVDQPAAVPKKTPEEVAEEEARKKAADDVAAAAKQNAADEVEKNRLAAKAAKTAEIKKKTAEDANVGITSELFTSMKGLGTDNLGSSVKKITKDNVIEIMQIWDSSYKDSMGGDSLLEAINNEWCFGKTKWLGMGDTSILTTIQQALVARAKDLGLGRDAQAFNDLVSKEINAPIWTSDRDVEDQFEKMRKAIEAKEKGTAK